MVLWLNLQRTLFSFDAQLSNEPKRMVGCLEAMLAECSIPYFLLQLPVHEVSLSSMGDWYRARDGLFFALLPIASGPL